MSRAGPENGETPDAANAGASHNACVHDDPSTAIRPRPGDIVMDRYCGGTELQVVAVVGDEMTLVPVKGTGSMTAPITDRFIVTSWDLTRRVVAALPDAVRTRVREQDIRAIVDESVRQIAGAP